MEYSTKKRLLFLDDNPYRHNQTDVAYPSSRYDVVHCYTLDDFLNALEAFDRFDVVSLDHDLNDFHSKSVSFDGQEATGMDACGFLANKRFRSKVPDTIIVHSVNPCGAQNMCHFLASHGFRPFWRMFKEAELDNGAMV